MHHRHIFRTARPTNVKLGELMEPEDPHHRHVQRPQRLKVKVTGPLNAVTENRLYNRDGNGHELQTWYTDRAHFR